MGASVAPGLGERCEKFITLQHARCTRTEVVMCCDLQISLGGEDRGSWGLEHDQAAMDIRSDDRRGHVIGGIGAWRGGKQHASACRKVLCTALKRLYSLADSVAAQMVLKVLNIESWGRGSAEHKPVDPILGYILRKQVAAQSVKYGLAP